ncbi:unnamed protein product [Kuraishia capsulata CBS 1993]|uniref:Uncharacterized protein n=1 Tax=Kuraishia capsulata CBS 1993 TaxID=1382522 RepID=W6MR82_9ASCO|nr:uncharacterized protein KUCA_T00004853001 [Kuraishia capsulata CBS 1993]CDK28868.1 unnamed protein product [Kuraishia capsulata CBS 1993]
MSAQIFRQSFLATEKFASPFLMSATPRKYSFSIPDELQTPCDPRRYSFSIPEELQMPCDPPSYSAVIKMPTTPATPARKPAPSTAIPSPAKVERFKSSGGARVLKLLQLRDTALTAQDMELVDRLMRLGVRLGRPAVDLCLSYFRTKGVRIPSARARAVNRLSARDVAYLDAAYAG